MRYLFYFSAFTVVVLIYFSTVRLAPSSDDFETKAIDAGQLTRGETVYFDFALREQKEIKVKDFDVLCDCGCMQVLDDICDLATNTIRFKYTSSRRLGSFRKACKILHKKRKIGELVVYGVVVPEVELSPSSLTFSSLIEFGNRQELKIKRGGLTVDQFQSLKVRVASSAIDVTELSRNADEVKLRCIANTAFPQEIDKGLYCEIIESATGKSHTVARVP